jgi:hypothetical protein
MKDLITVAVALFLLAAAFLSTCFSASKDVTSNDRVMCAYLASVLWMLLGAWAYYFILS